MSEHNDTDRADTDRADTDRADTDRADTDTDRADHRNLTLVLGGNGKTGARVAHRLTELGVPVRIGSRTAVRPFDWDDASTWAPVLDGVTAVYLTYQPDQAFPGAAETVGAFARLAVVHGARRLVLLSGRNEEGAQRGEKEVQNAGAEWTIVRSSFFAQNFSEGFWYDSVMGGELAVPAGEVEEPFIDIDDIAEIVVQALTTDAHVGQLYEVTGPRLMTFGDVAEELAKATGREVRYLPVSADEFAAALLAEGLPADFVDGTTGLFTEVFDGRSSYLADGVQRALGRPPTDFADYASRAFSARR